MQYLDDTRWLELIDARAEQPQLAIDRLRNRSRRPLLTDGRLFIVAADHTARGMLGVPGEPFAMAGRRRTLEALLCALDRKLAFGTMNRGGIMGAHWELDDRMTAYSAATLQANGLDGGKVLLRLADVDAGTAPTLQACAQAVNECAALGMPIMVEPLPYHHDPSTGLATLLTTRMHCSARSRSPQASVDRPRRRGSRCPRAANPERMLSCTTLPASILGGTPGADPEATYRSWEHAMQVPNVRGLVVGRALLYPPDGDVAGAIKRAAAIVRPPA